MGAKIYLFSSKGALTLGLIKERLKTHMTKDDFTALTFFIERVQITKQKTASIENCCPNLLPTSLTVIQPEFLKFSEKKLEFPRTSS